MKTKWFIYLITCLLLASCGQQGGQQEGGTETGTTETGETITGENITVVADALVPNITATNNSDSDSLTHAALTDGTSEQWDVYLEPNNIVYLEDIFAAVDPVPENNPVTRIRVVLDSYNGSVQDIFSGDPSLDCTGTRTGLFALDEGDELELPFFGNTANGSSDNRYYDCIVDENEDADHDWTQVVLYGKDSENVLRIAILSDNTTSNSIEMEIRGDTVRNMQVINTTYVEVAGEATSTAYLDLHYSQATVYDGVDGIFGTEDDHIFRSRTDITGTATLDAEGTVSLAAGDFIVTKYDKGQGGNGTSDELWDRTTKTIGRGSYAEGDFSLFRIESDDDFLAASAGTFCIQSEASDLPAYAQATDCSALEESVPWGEASFPFTIVPSIEEVFADKEFFEGNDEDLIAADGSNFEIPEYNSAEAE